MRATERRLVAFIGAMVCASGGVTACNDSRACGDKLVVSSVPEAPHIASADVATQLEEDSWTLALSVDFADANADLASGSIVFYLEDQSDSATLQPLRPAFKQSALSESATSGTLVLPLRFDDGISDGANVHLGLQLVDGASLRSNCYGLALAFEVTRR